MAAAAADIGYDAIVEILVRSDAEDVIRCKSVCKSWYSLISTPCFVESHLKHANNRQLNNNNNNKRITGIRMNSGFLCQNMLFVIGSSNGLVCISPEGFQLLVVNPCTRQTMKIRQPPPQPLPKSDRRWHMVWGFGYDSANNDYKIVAGLVTKTSTTRFYVFSLKTCLWKFIEEIDYVPYNRNNVSGILYDGALHWHRKHAILSFNLSREEFTNTQLPDDHSLENDDAPLYNLGVMEECLCIYQSTNWGSRKIWVLRSDASSGKQSWVLLPRKYVMNYNAIYLMDVDDDDYDYSIDDDAPQLLSSNVEYINAPIYVRTLVSPHLNIDTCSKSGSNDVVISVEEKAAGK